MSNKHKDEYKSLLLEVLSGEVLEYKQDGKWHGFTSEVRALEHLVERMKFEISPAGKHGYYHPIRLRPKDSKTSSPAYPCDHE